MTKYKKNLCSDLFVVNIVCFFVLVYNGFWCPRPQNRSHPNRPPVQSFFRQNYFVIIAANSGSHRKCKNDKQAGIVFLPVLLRLFGFFGLAVCVLLLFSVESVSAVFSVCSGFAIAVGFLSDFSTSASRSLSSTVFKNTHFRFVRPCQSQNKTFPSRAVTVINCKFSLSETSSTSCALPFSANVRLSLNYGFGGCFCRSVTLCKRRHSR